MTKKQRNEQRKLRNQHNRAGKDAHRPDSKFNKQKKVFAKLLGAPPFVLDKVDKISVKTLIKWGYFPKGFYPENDIRISTI